MSHSSDDHDVGAFFGHGEPSAADPQDAAVMRAATEVLRGLEPNRPVVPSAELAALMAAGLPAAHPVRRRARAFVTRFASLGVAAKAMLAAGVAIAGAGGAATAVAFSTGHLDLRHHHPAGHPVATAHASPHPSASDRHRTGDNATPEPSQSGTPQPGIDDRNHDGRGRDHGGPGDQRGGGHGRDGQRGERQGHRHGGFGPGQGKGSGHGQHSGGGHGHGPGGQGGGHGGDGGHGGGDGGGRGGGGGHGGSGSGQSDG